MDDPLRAICHELGFFTRAHTREAGYDDRAVTREARARRWVRIRRGYYTFPDTWSAATDEERHVIRCRAVLDSLGDDVVLSHVSGCLAHGIDVWDVGLHHVHVTRLDGGAGRIEAGVVHHEGLVLDSEVSTVDGMRVLAPSAACWRPARCPAGRAPWSCSTPPSTADPARPTTSATSST